MTITEFLLVRIAEDEAAAEAAVAKSGRSWHREEGHTGSVVGTSSDYRSSYRSDPGILWDWESGFICAHTESVDHIARHDPARVVAECAAKRRIIEDHVLDVGLDDRKPGCRSCSETSYYDGGRYSTGWPCETLAALASVYADHRDYDPAWRDADD